MCSVEKKTLECINLSMLKGFRWFTRLLEFFDPLIYKKEHIYSEIECISILR
jgi:hypothetical protein